MPLMIVDGGEESTLILLVGMFYYVLKILFVICINIHMFTNIFKFENLMIMSKMTSRYNFVLVDLIFI